jgi:hypothetical protein
MPKRKRPPQLDGAALLGNRRLTCGHVEAVLSALPANYDHRLDNINVDAAFRDAIAELYDNTDVAHNLKLDLKGGKTFDWPIARPAAYLRSLVCVSPALRRAIYKLKVPNSFHQPWSLILYLDEITPGNIAAPMNGSIVGVSAAHDYRTIPRYRAAVGHSTALPRTEPRTLYRTTAHVLHDRAIIQCIYRTTARDSIPHYRACSSYRGPPITAYRVPRTPHYRTTAPPAVDYRATHR